MGVNKIVYDGNTLIDLSSDTVVADALMKGVVAHDKEGNRIVGRMFDYYREYINIGAPIDLKPPLITPINKVVYNGKILIDLSNDSITPDMLQTGFLAHGSDGQYIIGTMFEGMPEEYSVSELLEDSEGNTILSDSGKEIEGEIVYRKISTDTNGNVTYKKA